MSLNDKAASALKRELARAFPERGPDDAGHGRLADALLSDMPADNLTERNNHLSHCRNIVAGWSMRDVLDFLYSRCATVEDYKLCAGTDEMSEVDSRNRERAAKFMAGCPEIVTFSLTRASGGAA
jgi:hypothetical protein